jgi:hypothetical protein
VTIPLRGLSPGPHRLEVGYRPDIDEPARSATVDFTVAGAGSNRQSGSVRLAVVVVTVALAGFGLFLGWRARSSRPQSRPKPAGS